LHTDWQSIPIPGERYHNGRVTGQVERDSAVDHAPIVCLLSIHDKLCSFRAVFKSTHHGRRAQQYRPIIKEFFPDLDLDITLIERL